MWLNIQFSTVLNAFTMGHFAVYQYVPFFFFCCCQTVRQKNLQQCRNSTLFLRSFFLVYVFHFYFYSSMKNLCELKMEIREPNPLKYARISILGNYLSFKCLLWMWNPLNSDWCLGIFFCHSLTQWTIHWEKKWPKPVFVSFILTVLSHLFWGKRKWAFLFHSNNMKYEPNIL